MLNKHKFLDYKGLHEGDSLMEYVTKICPSCGNKFVVSKITEEKAIYCTIECLVKAQKSSWHQEGCLSAVE